MKIDRQFVLDKYDGRCAYCGCNLTIKQMQVDHIIPKYIAEPIMFSETEIIRNCNEHNIESIARISMQNAGELNHPDNLLPACRQCNFYKDTKTIEAFRHDIEETIWHKLEKDFNYRLLKKYGMIEEHRKKVIFFFENYNTCI